MPRYKVLKSVAHNIGHSFTSLMNFAGDDYSLGHILRFARETGEDTIRIDLATGKGEPPVLLREPIAGLPQWYSKMFWSNVQSSGSDRTLIQSASLTLRYNLQRTRGGTHPENSYDCEVCVKDIRGKIYSAHFEGWWYVERERPQPAIRWWNPTTWFRSRLR